MKLIFKNALAVVALTVCTQAAAEVVFHESESFQGRTFTSDKAVRNLERSTFATRASSAVVLTGQWEMCDDNRFGGRCMVLRPGRYPSVSAMGLNDRVASVRAVNANARIDQSRYAAVPAPVYNNRRRKNERVYEANVTSVRAVVGTPEQRCWIAKEEVPQDRTQVSIPGALIGAVLGGVLGHQVGSGSGNTIATIGGAVVGGAAGSQVGRLGIGGQKAETRDVQRCENVPGGATPDHWDVTYEFQGQEHRMQTTTAPGTTVRVNSKGEPRA